MTSSNDHLSARLRDGDPAARSGAPHPDAVESVRRHLRAAAREHRAAGRAPARLPGSRLAWAAGLAGALILGLLLLREERRAPQLADAAVALQPLSVRLEMQASNGVRVYWTIQPATDPPDSKGESP